MNLEILDPESQQLYTELKATVIAHAEKVAITFDALVRIRDGRLYRAEFKTFSAFCDSVGMNTRKAYRLLEDKARKPKRIASEKTELKNGILVRHTSQKITPEDVSKALDEEPVIPAEIIIDKPGDGHVATPTEIAAQKVAAMMQKLSLKPVIDVRAEQYRTHTPIPAMDRPEEKEDHVLKVSDLPPYKPWDGQSTGGISDWPAFVKATYPHVTTKAIASTELKAWAVKRRSENDATSEDDAAWADYIAQKILL